MAEPRPAQPFEALARKGAELVVMMREQVVFHCQLERLWAQSERQTKVLESLVARAGSTTTPVSIPLLHGGGR